MLETVGEGGRGHAGGQTLQENGFLNVNATCETSQLDSLFFYDRTQLVLMSGRRSRPAR